MKKQLAELLQSPEVKELAVSMAGIAAGLVIQKLIAIALRRTSFGWAGKLIQLGFAAWLASNPAMIEGFINRLIGSPSNAEG